MPTYDYKCTECQHSFETILKMNDRNIPESEPCPNCSKQNCIELVVGAASLVSPFAIEGLKKPGSDFRDRMDQIRSGHKKVRDLSGKIREY